MGAVALLAVIRKIRQNWNLLASFRDRYSNLGTDDSPASFAA